MWENFWLLKKLKKHQRRHVQEINLELVENILNTRETEDTLQKTTCAEHSEVAQFVENILDLEEFKDWLNIVEHVLNVLKKTKMHQRKYYVD